MLHNIVEAFTGGHHANGNGKKVKYGEGEKRTVRGTVVLMKKNVLDLNDFNDSVLDSVHELLGGRVSFRLVSSVHGEPENGLQGKLGAAAYLEEWITTITPLNAGESAFKVTFDWDQGDDGDIGFPGAFIVRNEHHSEFYLRTLTLENVPGGHGHVHFVCNSWVYPAKHYEKDRIFFANKTYLPHETPTPLIKYREEELKNLRGDGTGELKEWDRVYDYALYNDLGDPERGEKYARPVLGGSSEYPYPRRGRTGRSPSKADPTNESRLPILSSLNIYVPRDERFGHLKMSDFLAYALKSVGQVLKSELEGLMDTTPNEFDTFNDELKLYEGGVRILDEPVLQSIEKKIPLELLKEIFRTDGEGLLKFPEPEIIAKDKTAWRTDEEFAREMLAGVNPVMISCLQEFPPKSKLDHEQYGNQDSKITEDHIKHNLDGVSIKKAIESKRLLILDYHDALMPYIRRINTTSTKTYASRTLLFLKDDGTLKPLAIELSLPHPESDKLGAISKVFTPAEEGVESSIWQLAKAYVAVNDSGWHQLISHWLHTHATIEPFVIATNRQLSVVHPIHKLLHPHFRDTMNINAFARQILINAGGILELTVFPSKYAMEMSSYAYKSWVFPEQALPEDLKKRDLTFDESAEWKWDDPSPPDMKINNEVAEFDHPPIKGTRSLQSIYHRCNLSLQDPSTFEEASSEGVWIAAMEEEIRMIQKNDTWELVDRPQHHKVIGVKWVFRTKLNSDGSINKYKARLVVKGYSQEQGVDFNETFAPVARFDTIRMLLALSAAYGWKIWHLDVKSAFLNGFLQETVYVDQPQGFIIPEKADKVYKLHKALYGLKQAPRAWYSRIDTFLLQNGFSRSDNEAALYIKKVNGHLQLIVSLYVDDLLITGGDASGAEAFRHSMEKEFEMSDLGLMQYFLGLEILQKSEGIFLTQKKYALDILNKFKMEEANPVPTPLASSIKLSKEDDSDLVDAKLFRSIVGCLLYLSNSRPDIMYAASFLSRFMKSPRETHLVAAKRVLRYVKGTSNLGITYTKLEVAELEGFCDSDWAGNKDDSKSTSGYVFTFKNGAFTWNSKKQEVVAQSSAEAEYISAAAASNQALWLRKMLTDIGMEQQSPTQLHIDNKSAIAITQNPVYHGRTKHIAVKFHAIREAVKAKEIEVLYCPSQDQLADIFTKALSREKFEELRWKLGVSNNNLKEEC